MFKLNPAATFPATVLITVPGVPEPQLLQLVFRTQTRKALGAWVKRPAELARAAADRAAADEAVPAVQASAPASDSPADSAVNDVSYLAEVITDWSDVQGPDGQPLPYSPEALDGLLDACPAAAGELFNGYLKALTESRAKN